MHKILSRGAAAAIVAVLAHAAHADADRSYLDLRLIGTADGGGFRSDDGAGGTLAATVDDGLGWGLRGAWAFAPRWHLYGEWGVSNTTLKVSRADAGGTQVDSQESDFDLTRVSVGVGYTWPVGESWALYGRVTWDMTEYGDFDTFELDGVGTVSLDDEDDSGIGTTIGARWTTGNWELDGWGRLTSVGELVQDGDGVKFDNDFGGGVRAAYRFGKRWSVGADYELADIDTWSAFVRYRF